MQQILGNLMTCGRQVTKNSTIDGGTRWRGGGGYGGGKGGCEYKIPLPHHLYFAQRIQYMLWQKYLFHHN